MSNHLMTVDETSQYLGLSTWTVRDMARHGSIPGHKVGKEWRFYQGELDDDIKASRSK